jgi:hypothetical protein
MWGLERNMDELSAQQWMNYTNIDQHWIDQGFNKDNLPGLYKGLFWGTVAYLLSQIKLD